MKHTNGDFKHQVKCKKEALILFQNKFVLKTLLLLEKINIKKMSKCLHAKFHYMCKFEVDNQKNISINIYHSDA